MTKKILLSVCFTILYTQAGICQSSTNSLSNWFDTNVGRENLCINNGYINTFDYITRDNSNPYFKDSKFEKGSVSYDGQLFDDLHLNYDSYNDELLLKPNGTQDLRSVIVIKQKVSRFRFLDNDFVNLSPSKNKTDFISGYYAEKVISDRIVLYTKFSKSRTEKIYNTKLFSEFNEVNEFVISFNNNLFKYTQNSVNQIYPALKSDINRFYSDNSKLEKSNEKQFVENLLNHLESLSK